MVIILSAETKNIDNCKIDVVYSAEVIDVYRSNSNLRVGDEITIHSWNINRSSVCVGGGPRPPMFLSAGRKVNAYLNPIGGREKTFNIAAYGDSFEKTHP